MELELFLRMTRQTQGNFAKKVGVTRTWLNLVMTGKKEPSLRLVKLIEIETNGAVLLKDLQKKLRRAG